MESQQARVLIELRDLILRGEFSGGERLAEIPMADRLKVSRTPVRVALATLEREGLVEASSGGGYVVRRFTGQEIADSLAVRSLLEGMAARLVTEHGVPRKLAHELQDCLAEGDRLLADLAPEAMAEACAGYIEMNNRFHDLIVEASGNDSLIRAVQFIKLLPFASPSALLPMQGPPDQGGETMRFAHRQHHLIVHAMTSGQSARAQALTEEHGHIADINLKLALERREEATKLMPAMRLVVGGATR